MSTWSSGSIEMRFRTIDGSGRSEHPPLGPGIVQPTFVAIGDNDTMMHTRNSQLLADRLPNAHLRIHADANHGFLNQYPELFADHVRAFLNAG